MQSIYRIHFGCGELAGLQGSRGCTEAGDDCDLRPREVRESGAGQLEGQALAHTWRHQDYHDNNLTAVTVGDDVISNLTSYLQNSFDSTRLVLHGRFDILTFYSVSKQTDSVHFKTSALDSSTS